MRIDSLVNVEPQAPIVALPRPLFRVGAILEAIAVRDVTSGQLWLQLDNQQRLPARIASGTQDGPADGEVLKLRVLRDSPVLALETIAEPVTEQNADDALRRILPKQISPTLLLANLNWMARHPEQLALWPATQQKYVNQLWNALPDIADLVDVAQLQEALVHSGTFLESELTKSAAEPALPPVIARQDYKAALLALRAQLQDLDSGAGGHRHPPGPLPSLANHVVAIPVGPASLAALDRPMDQLNELKQQIDGTLARLQTNQLLNEQAAQQGLQQWLIDLPVRDGDHAELLRFKFERDARGNAQQAESWSVQVALDLGAAGTLHAELQLHSRNGLAIKLRSESPSMIDAINRELPVLSSALQAQGLPINRIVCLHGLPVDSAAMRLNKLLDLHA